MSERYKLVVEMEFTADGFKNATKKELDIMEVIGEALNGYLVLTKPVWLGMIE